MSKHLSEIFFGARRAFGVKLFAAALSYLMSWTVIKTVGSDKAGYFFLSYSIAFYLAMIARQGFDNALVKLISSYEAEQERWRTLSLYPYALIRVFTGSILICVIMVIVVTTLGDRNQIPRDLHSWLNHAILAVPLIAIATFFSKVMSGLKKPANSLAILSLIPPLILCASLAFVYLSDPALLNSWPELSLLLYAIGFACSIMWGWFFFPYRKVRSEQNYSNEVVSDIKPLLWSFFLILILNTTVARGMGLAIGFYETGVALTVFYAAQRIAQLVSFVLTAVGAIATPKFSELYSLGEIEEVKATYSRSSRLLAFIGLFISLVICLFSREIMGLYGEEFIEYWPALVILTIGQFVNVATGNVGLLLQMTDSHRYVVLVNTISVAVLVIGIVMILPHYGLYGAVAVQSIAISIKNLVNLVHVYRLFGIFF